MWPKHGPLTAGGRAGAGIMKPSPIKRRSMKPSLYVKVWILLGYVLVCTALVLFDAPDPPPRQGEGISAPTAPDRAGP
jgi:hypothetical protein